MSIKTLRKRIALVAVSALGVGLLSVAPANAANEADITAGTALSTGVVSALAGSTADTADTDIVATITSTGRLSINVAAGTGATNVTVSGGVFTGASSGVASYSSAQTTATSSNTTAIASLIVAPNGVGVMVIKSYDGAVAAANLIDTATITVVAAASIGKLDASKSFASLESSGTADNSASTYTDEDGANVRTNGNEGIIDWSINDENGNNMPSTTVVTASATNGALVAFSSGTQLGSTASTTGTDGAIYVAQPTENAPVSTVVTISVNGAVWTSKSLTITGDVTKISIINYTDGRTASSGTVTGTLLAYAYDSAGNQVVRTISAVGALYDSVVSATSATIATSATTYATGTYTCASAGSAKVQYYITNTALATIKSPVVDVRCAADPYTYTASLDKATYAPGEIATLTITAKDSKGNLTNGVATLGTNATADLVVTGGQLTAVSTPTNSDTFSSASGVKTYKFTVGTTEGSYNMIVDLPKWNAGGAGGGNGAAQTVSYTIKSSSTAVSTNEVLAAIVKLIATINKQIRQLQKQLRR